jgi:glycosyltransferase involved in cell wall biosynthesis
VGGTNPSLVEAMALGLNILAHDNRFNRITTNNMCTYFNLDSFFEALDFAIRKPFRPDVLKEYCRSSFTWASVADTYYKALIEC